ncbi:MAG: response regulator [Ignavibacteriae bacterium]|nr:response regulator [Ignavibacteriota bacterium]
MYQEILRVLLIEDDEHDAYMVNGYLSGTFKVDWVQTLEEGLSRLSTREYDVVLTDLSLPDSAGRDTLKAVLSAAPQLPIILISGQHSERFAVKTVTEGVQDYFFKDMLQPDSLRRSIRYSVERKRNERERERLLHELQEALDKVKALSGLLPMCAWCKKIRDDDGYWHQVEEYLTIHTDAKLTHGICKECSEKIMKEIEHNRQ